MGSATDQLTSRGATALAPFSESPDDALQNIFGHDSFRDGQRRVIERLVDGEDALVVMPTGSGKSLCYQLTATLTEGLTVVISPLIALMQDQTDSLSETGLPATCIHSGLTRDEQQSRISGIRRGDYKIVYIAPERFRSPTFRDALDDVPIGLFAIDEAHCISEWGHDFRPDYRTLSEVRHDLGDPQTVALTATATEDVQRDILDQLDLLEARVLVGGFERPNLYFETHQARSRDQKIQRIEALVDHVRSEEVGGGSVIVYAATRKQVERVHGKLSRHDIDTAYYHAGLTDQQRNRAQSAWMTGEATVLVATNAFGMGVDKPDVRAVIHYHMPGSVEAYYQEAGRAGRDGDNAWCLLLFNFSDTGLHEWFADNSYPQRHEVIRVWETLRRKGPGRYPIPSQGLADTLSDQLDTHDDYVHPMCVESALRLLAEADVIELGRQHYRVLDDTAPDELAINFTRVDRRRRAAKQKVDDLVEYATHDGCLQAQLLAHFGSEPDFGDRCGHCSSCEPAPGYVDASPERVVKTSDSPARLLKKVLSGLARADGRRGAHAVAGMLVGSEAKAVKDAGFQRLSTYGILDDLYKKDVIFLIDALTRYGLATRDEHGCVLLTDEGNAVMRGRAPDDAVAQFLKAATTQARSRTSRQANRSGSTGTSDTYRRTKELLESGLSPAGVADERDLTERTINNHLLTLADSDQLDPDVLDVDHHRFRQLVEVADDWSAGDKLRPLKDALPDDWSYAEIKQYLAVLLTRRHQQQ
jgi:ATP-dependent DNA helicase RecQ